MSTEVKELVDFVDKMLKYKKKTVLAVHKSVDNVEKTVD